MLDNKWKDGKVFFTLPPELPSILIASPGIKPISAVLDKRVGEEVILLITEPKHRVEEFKGKNRITFVLKPGLINTSYGPVCFFLFCFSGHTQGGQVAYEIVLNPKDYQFISIYEQLSNQKYWHVFIADDMGEVVNFFEFPNQYGLKETLDQIRKACEKMQVTDFMAAKAEYENTYTIDQLLAI